MAQLKKLADDVAIRPNLATAVIRRTPVDGMWKRCETPENRKYRLKMIRTNRHLAAF
jgi:hypothetical protein